MYLVVELFVNATHEEILCRRTSQRDSPLAVAFERYARPPSLSLLPPPVNALNENSAVFGLLARWRSVLTARDEIGRNIFIRVVSKSSRRGQLRINHSFNEILAVDRSIKIHELCNYLFMTPALLRDTFLEMKRVSSTSFFPLASPYRDQNKNTRGIIFRRNISLSLRATAFNFLRSNCNS